MIHLRRRLVEDVGAEGDHTGRNTDAEPHKGQLADENCTGQRHEKRSEEN